jgi:hypothetical protein
MTQKYVAAPGCAIAGGWPADGRPINPLSLLHLRMVKDGDLIEMTDTPEAPAKSQKAKDVTDGQ